jgi:hypothetical protein
MDTHELGKTLPALRRKGKEIRKMAKPFMKYVSWCLVMAMFVMGIVPRVYAGFSPSEVIVLSEFDRSADLGKIQKILETKMIRERLEKFGFSQAEIRTRLEQLSDQQIHQLALRLDELKVGGDGTVVIIILLAVALGFVLWLYFTNRKVRITK